LTARERVGIERKAIRVRTVMAMPRPDESNNPRIDALEKDD